MCFGAVGDAIGDAFHSVDTLANSINPFKGITDWGTDNTLGKIPGVGKPLAQLADWGDSHPAEVGAAIGSGWAAATYLGTGAAAAAGDGGLGAGDIGAAGDVGTAGSGFADVGTAGSGFSDPWTVGGAAGAGAGGETAAGAGAGGSGSSAGAGASGTAPAATSPWVSGAETAAKYAAPAVISSLLQPKPPKTKALEAMPDPLAQQQAQQQKLLQQLARRGRSSTILTSPGSAGGSLGG